MPEDEMPADPSIPDIPPSIMTAAEAKAQAEAEAPPESTQAVPVFVLGLISLIVALPGCLCGLLAPVSGTLGAIALFMGLKEHKKVEAGEVAPNTLLTAGWIMGIVGLALSLLFLAVLVVQLVLGGVSALTEGFPSGSP